MAIRTVTVRVTDGHSSVYRARAAGCVATATSTQENAAKSAAAKALGLCPRSCPPHWGLSRYYREIGEACWDITLRRVDSSTFEASTDKEPTS